MRHSNKVIVFVAMHILFNTALAFQEKNLGVCIVPVADLIGAPAKEYQRLTATEKTYRSFPHSTLKSDNSCPRLHQLLFNEVVEIKQIGTKEVLISIPNYFYEAKDKPGSQNTTYWTLRDNIISFNDLHKLGVATNKFPAPITMHQSNVLQPLRNTVTLKKPFFDPMTRTIYSAGTRFMLSSHQLSDSLGVYAYDPERKKVSIIYLPSESCISYDEKNKNEYRTEFVQLIKSWAHLDQGFIPYVLGGSSYNELCASEAYEEEKLLGNSQYRRAQCKYPYSGLDCGGLIARAAQAVGIPFYAKNSIAIAHFLAPLKKGEQIEEGDIVWIPGHVMVISDLKNNQLIEARSYMHGYGKVHEIPLRDEFKNMNTYHDLLYTYFNHKPLSRLDKNGVHVQTFDDFKILKLSSAWRTNQ